MARTINLEENLSEEDKRYLLERDLHQDIATAKKNGTWGDDHPIEKRARMRVRMEAMLVDGEPPSDLNRPKEYYDSDEPAGPSDTEYERWKRDELVLEIQRRNENLDPEDRMSMDGTKAELAARLREDDELSTS